VYRGRAHSGRVFIFKRPTPPNIQIRHIINSLLPTHNLETHQETYDETERKDVFGILWRALLIDRADPGNTEPK